MSVGETWEKCRNPSHRALQRAFARAIWASLGPPPHCHQKDFIDDRRVQARLWPLRNSAKGVVVVFAEDGVKLGPATRKALGPAAELVARAAKAERFTGKKNSALDLIAPAGLKAARLIVIGVGKSAEFKPKDFLKLGGLATGKLPNSASDATVFAELSGGAMKPEQAADLAQGARLRAYAFDRYKTKSKDDEKFPAARNLTVAVGDVAATRKAYEPRSAISGGVLIARDLVNEPANVLYPEEFARRAGALKKLRRRGRGSRHQRR